MTTESNRPVRPDDVKLALRWIDEAQYRHPPTGKQAPIMPPHLSAALKDHITSLEARVAELETLIAGKWPAMYLQERDRVTELQQEITRLRQEREEAWNAAREVLETPYDLEPTYKTFQDWLNTREGGK
jgi:hypothetical protein